MVDTRKKLIEVALPLDDINAASAREKSIRHGHPSTLHLWWSRKPLATARAVIFAQMVDDPSSCPELFPTEQAQIAERERLFDIIKELVQWKNSGNETLLQQAREEIWQSWRRCCADHADAARAEELFDPDRLPGFHDPFAGGGSLPVEAQRLGLASHASDLNPVAVLINKAMVEIPARFAGNPPVNPESRAEKSLAAKRWQGAAGLAEDVRYYGRWVRDEAEKRIGYLYPRIEITADMAESRPDLRPLIGERLTVNAWLWARTMPSPNPAFAHLDVPLVSSFLLSDRPGKEAYLEPIVEDGAYRFTVRTGKPANAEKTSNGTSAGKRKAFQCIMSDVPIGYDHIRTESKAGRMASRLMAIVAQGLHGRVFLAPTPEHEARANQAAPAWLPSCEMPIKHRNFQPPGYGMLNLADLFTSRQLVALTSLSDLIGEVRETIRRDAASLGDETPLCDGGAGAVAYSDAVATYLAFTISKCADYWNAHTRWMPRGTVGNLFARQAIPMIWDYPEANPFSDFHCAWHQAFTWVARSMETLPATASGDAWQEDAMIQSLSTDKVISTDPPYYDNIGYADLSDFFYVWLRHALAPVFPELFATLTVPKKEELIAAPHRHGGKHTAREFFLSGMGQAMRRLAEQCHPAFPVTIYYAFKQSEGDGENGATNTGWATFLDAVIDSGFAITGTWPMRTERGGRINSQEANALASSIVLACRPRLDTAPIAQHRQFVTALRNELPAALAKLQSGHIAPVDLAQAAIGPGMAIYTRYDKIIDIAGNILGVRAALSLINQILDEILAEHDDEVGAETRWALAWFEQNGFTAGEYGTAETLSKAKNIRLGDLVGAGWLEAGAGKVRLLRPDELPEYPGTGTARPTEWEVIHLLIRALETGGEGAAAALVAGLGHAHLHNAHELAYRLYRLCERSKWPNEARAYDGLVRSWPELMRLARAHDANQPVQTSMF